MNECSTCRHYAGRDAPEGRCRRFPPTATGHGNPDRAAAYAWPVVAAYSNCGEWSAVEVVEPVPVPEVAKKQRA